MQETPISLLAIATAFLAGSALAADLPKAKGAPIVALSPPSTWAGFYFGANIGGVFDAASGVNTTARPLFNDTAGLALGAPSFFGAASAASIPGAGSLSNVGVIGGGQIGFNWQLSTNFLAGLEADIQGATLSSVASPSGAAVETSTGSLVTSKSNLTKNLNYLGTVRGRLGYLVTPTLLVFGSGGLAFGGMTFTNGIFQSSSNANFPLAAVSANYGDAQIGWAAGGGVEWMLLPNWSAKAEYLYYDLGSVTTSNLLSGVTPAGNPLYASSFQSSTHISGHVVRAGLNYHFRWFAPAPVVAKY
jgi:outer membrane immunogenic protein